ncbi:GroES-like protein [Thozetella sp. PMI_491]|nr:GroES-like protein [Thozetella sp. PMI_491]
MASNTAAWITSPCSRPFEVKSAPLVAPAENQILLKNRAIAINPLDGRLQKTDFFKLQYPTIFGMDVAGEVAQVGPGVTRFKVGDRVMGHANGFGTRQDSEKGFQAYTILRTNMCCEIPDSLSFERAVVLPLAVSTVSAGFFLEDFLGLQLPSETPKPTGKSLLVWGGASCCGSAAIQFAVAAGYEVITTASEKNFAYVKKLGASQVFDYHSPTVVSDLIGAFKGKTLVGAFDTVGGPAWAPTIEVVAKSEGRKLVITILNMFPDGGDVTVKQSHAPMIMPTPVSEAIWCGFLPKALESGTIIPAPDPLVAGTGLESIQAAVDLQAKGTSAQKVVVLL